MNNFYIITNAVKDPDLHFTHKVMDALRERGQRCTLREERENKRGGVFRYTDPAMIPAETDCILVLGGDGTLLRSATDTIDRQIPLIGVNLGTLGFLAELDRASVMEALDPLIHDDYQIERRMLLNGTVIRGGKEAAREIALNDIIIRHPDAPNIISVDNYVNDAYLNTYKADGIIISTPTGSTGYSLSIGGPIISPKAELIMMTPLAPHELNNRSIIFPKRDRIRVVVGPGRDGTTQRAAAYFDGENEFTMASGDAIEIRRDEREALFVKLNDDSFLETLSKKMSHG